MNDLIENNVQFQEAKSLLEKIYSLSLKHDMDIEAASGGVCYNSYILTFENAVNVLENIFKVISMIEKPTLEEYLLKPNNLAVRVGDLRFTFNMNASLDSAILFVIKHGLNIYMKDINSELTSNLANIIIKNAVGIISNDGFRERIHEMKNELDFITRKISEKINESKNDKIFENQLIAYVNAFVAKLNTMTKGDGVNFFVKKPILANLNGPTNMFKVCTSSGSSFSLAVRKKIFEFSKNHFMSNSINCTCNRTGIGYDAVSFVNNSKIIGSAFFIDQYESMINDRRRPYGFVIQLQRNAWDFLGIDPSAAILPIM